MYIAVRVTKELATSKELRQKAFLPRTIREWNGLSQKTVDAPSAAAFKNKLLGLPQ